MIETLARSILDIDGIVGVGTSRTVKIFVESEDYIDAVPQSIGRRRVEVVVTGKLYALGLRDRIRPVMGGLSVGPLGVMSAGTAGAITKDGYLISNAHVLAMDINNNYLPGASIVQPATVDGGGSGDIIGHLVGYTRIEMNNIMADNYADVAVAKVTVPFEPLVIYSEEPYKVSLKEAEVKEGDVVRKTGRTTGTTYGKVVSTSATIKVWYGKDFAVFTDVILVVGKGELFSNGGDSGSFVDKNGDFVGLLFAGNPDTGYSVITKAKYVLYALNALTKKEVVTQDEFGGKVPAMLFAVPIAAVAMAALRKRA